LVKINGVKTPYFGLPAATVEAIKKNQCKLMVDWGEGDKKLTTYSLERICFIAWSMAVDMET